MTFSSPDTHCAPLVLDDLPRYRRIYCNRTLNMRHVEAIGYDMDYTLIHYHIEHWERRAYEYARQKLEQAGWPVAKLAFVPDLMVRGLILDTQLGNTLKVNSYGYVKQAYHGTQPLAHEAMRDTYARVVISLADKRFLFMNSLFSLSEACLYAQLVDLLDTGHLPGGVGYQDVYRRVQASIDEAHVEGQLKKEIIDNPEQFVQLDPDVPQALLDQRAAGKKLLLITNSGWAYTRAMMAYVIDPFLPPDMGWRDLFDIVIVSARKPDFFEQRAPLFEVVSDDGLLRPVHGGLKPGGAYLGGSASAVESALGLEGNKILYVGDHIYGDVNVSKQVLRWRTALILRDIEPDLEALDAFVDEQARLATLMAQKERLEFESSQVRLAELRRTAWPAEDGARASEIEGQMRRLREQLTALDAQIRPLAEAAGRLGNPYWGPLMRAGVDKSHLARQVERYADIYMSRVANFQVHTPFMYLRAMRGSLPHDPSAGLVPDSGS